MSKGKQLDPPETAAEETAAPETAAEETAAPETAVNGLAEAFLRAMDTAQARQASVPRKRRRQPAPDPYLEEKVRVQYLRDNDRYKGDVYLAINGKNLRVQRGEVVYIPRKYAMLAEQSMKQDRRTALMIERLQGTPDGR